MNNSLSLTLRALLFLSAILLTACTGTDDIIVTNGNTDACGNVIDHIEVLDAEGVAEAGHTIYRLSSTLWKIDDITYSVLPNGIAVDKAQCKGQATPVERIKLNGRTLPLVGIGAGAFSGCADMTAVSIPQSVLSIGDRAFDGCIGLTSVRLPDGLTHLGESAFVGCTGLTTIVLPSGVDSIAAKAFAGCISLASVTLPASVQYIAPFAFQGCSRLTSFVVPDGVKGIETSVFDGCTKLASVRLPESVGEIGAAAFRDCRSLASVAIPSGVKYIGDLAFSGCQSLTAIALPSAVLTIGTSTFSGCSALTNVYCYAAETPQITSVTFTAEQHDAATLHVPSAALSDYLFDLRWSQFKSLVPLD